MPADLASTSHDRHDPLLVAALAAGDLAGTDRDHAVALIADLRRVRRRSMTTSSRHRPRDGRRAASRSRRDRATSGSPRRMRRGCARPAGAGSSARSARSRGAFARPLGVGLTTLGIAGLLHRQRLAGLRQRGGGASSLRPSGGSSERRGRSAGRHAAPTAPGRRSEFGARPAAPAAAPPCRAAVPARLCGRRPRRRRCGVAIDSSAPRARRRRRHGPQRGPGRSAASGVGDARRRRRPRAAAEADLPARVDASGTDHRRSSPRPDRPRSRAARDPLGRPPLGDG